MSSLCRVLPALPACSAPLLSQGLWGPHQAPQPRDTNLSHWPRCTSQHDVGGRSCTTSISIPDEKTWHTGGESISPTIILIFTQLCETNPFQKASSSCVPHCGKSKTLRFHGAGRVGEVESGQEPQAATGASCCLLNSCIPRARAGVRW